MLPFKLEFHAKSPVLCGIKEIVKICCVGFFSDSVIIIYMCSEQVLTYGFSINSCMLKPGAHPRVGNPEVTGIPQVDSSTRQRQLISMHAEVTYLTKSPITTKPVVRTN